jgi:hypothetical protein
MRTASLAKSSKLDEECRRRLERLAEEDPASVHNVIVIFETNFGPDEYDVLYPKAGSQSTRDRRYQAAVRQAYRAQTEVRKFIENGEAQSFYRGAPAFRLEPRHVQCFPVTNTMVLPANVKMAERLGEMDQVKTVIFDGLTRPIFDIISAIAHKLGLTNDRRGHIDGYTWGWDRLGIRTAHCQSWKGQGTTVGIIDLGIYANHADLIGKVKDWHFTLPSGNIEQGFSVDFHGHGTHIGGTIAGGCTSGVQIGGAPGADLHGIGVFTDCTDTGLDGSYSALLAALEWFAGEKVDVINLSLSMPSILSAPTIIEEFEFFFDQLLLQQIACVAAIGNDPDVAEFPAAFDSVIACGAITPDGKVWQQSGKDPDFVLPGVHIYSSVPHDLERYRGLSYAWFSGTSMATAHMSALIALCRQRTGADIKDIVKAFENTARGEGLDPSRSGHGLPDLAGAVDYIRNRGLSRR